MDVCSQVFEEVPTLLVGRTCYIPMAPPRYMTAEISGYSALTVPECFDCGSVEYILSFEERDVPEVISYGVTCMGCGNYTQERVFWL